MQRLELDFRRGRAPSPWVGRVLLAVAVGFAADVGFSFHEIRDSVDAHKERLVRAQPRSAPAPRVTPEEIVAVRETVERIGLPWDSLFGALESAASEDIALSGIEPDPKTGSVLISGTGKDYLAALTYVLNLSRQETLTRVQLVRHEASSADPQGPVAFAISAGWSGGPR
ncbi:MAG TPA: PilN domain-containing protein [Burkholderiales bacterium]|nr:PilN domain-containing protein [Burkholderiales bacterium]